MRFHHLCSLFRRPLHVALVALCLGVAACGAPSVAEGTAGGRAFALHSPHTEVREHGADGGRTVVIAETEEASAPDQADALWVVSIFLPAELKVEVGEPLPIGPKGSGRVSLKVSVGELERLEVGGEIVTNAKDAAFVHAEAGEITLWSVDKQLAGEFVATLEGGGDIKGAFQADLD